MAHELANVQRGREHVGLDRARSELRECRADSRDGFDAARGLERRERPIRERDEPDLVVVRDAELGKARRKIRVVA